MDNHFFGIDLGTTNSVMAYASFDRQNRIESKVIKVNRLSESGGQIRSDKLPSVVFYKKSSDKGFSKIVGDYAKGQYGKRVGYVVKSIKSQMGENHVEGLNPEINDKQPEDVSAHILNHLLLEAKKQLLLQEVPKDVVITIPASFTPDMCQATINACKKAGIDTASHEMLLYEPKAVLYDFVNSQLRGEIPKSVVNLNSPKNILVYDLGGGTIDVSLHKVSFIENDELLKIEDLAISRYTNLGGDDFDDRIAELLYERFIAYIKQYNVDPKILDKSEVIRILKKKAEQCKIDLSDTFIVAQLNNRKLPDDYAVEILEGNLYGGYGYEDFIKPEIIEKTIEDLMGWHLNIDDVNHIDRLSQSSEHVNNIIYPILDTLSKAKDKYEDVKIDAVILNGGMTKFYLIKDRIKKLLNIEPITITDPDLSVAKGAVVYHYYLHKYGTMYQKEINQDVLKQIVNSITSTILNDTINLAVRGGKVKALVKAGTPLPFESETFTNQFLTSDESEYIKLSFYLGRGDSTDLPNRRIADRIVKLSKKYPIGTDISIKFYIDSMKLLRLEGWVTNNPKDKVLIEVDTNSLTEQHKGPGKNVVSNEPNRLNVFNTFNCLNQYCIAYEQIMKSKKNKNITLISQKIKLTINEILKCSNPEEFAVPILNYLQSSKYNDTFKSRLYLISGKIGKNWTKRQIKRFEKICLDMINPQRYYPKNNELIINCINALGYLKIKNAKNYLIYHLNHSLYKKHYANILITLGKIEEGTDEVIAYFKKLNINETGKLQNTLWALGKLCAREFDRCDVNVLYQVIDKLLFILKNKKHEQIIDNTIYALAEICDRRQIVKRPVSNKVADKVIEAINDAIFRYGLDNHRVEVAKEMIIGVDLSEEHTAQLLQLRTHND